MNKPKAMFEFVAREMENKKDILTRVREFSLLAVILGPSEEFTIEIVDALVNCGVVGIEIIYAEVSVTSICYQIRRSRLLC